MTARFPSSASPFAKCREPLETLFVRRGFAYRTKTKGGMTWYDFRTCPACGGEGYQCGVGEFTNARGELEHRVTCRNTNKNPFQGRPTPHYAEFLREIGELTADECARVLNYMADGPASPVRHGTAPAGNGTNAPPLRPKYPGSEANLRNRLLAGASPDCPDPAARGAWDYLTNPLGPRRLTRQTIERFGLGLSDPYTFSDKVADENLRGRTQRNCLVFPIMGRDAQWQNRNCFYNIPGVSEHPRNRNGWIPSGGTYTYYGTKKLAQRALFIAEGMKDVWRLVQELEGTRLTGELVIVTSVTGTAWPSEWTGPEFVDGYDAVYFGMDNDPAGNAAARRFKEEAGIAFRRVAPPTGKDWTDFFNAGGTPEQFERLLADAPFYEHPVADTVDDVASALARGEPVQIAYRPMRIGTYHDGHLTCTVQTVVVEPEFDEESAEIVGHCERLQTVVIRSDRQMLRAQYSRAPKGTPLKDRVLRLYARDDRVGTLIEKEPVVNRYSTWGWDGEFGIKKYLDGKAKPRPLRDILKDVMRHLKASVWLPYEEDYAVLALTVPLTYGQEIFDAVPYILLNGEKGSGKTETSIAMVDVSCNGHMSGNINAANVIRHIDESRGLIGIDDVDKIGEKSPNNADVVELEQALKVGYKKVSATKNWTDMKTGRSEVMYYFGVKIINNTTGVDDILGSRMIHIQTRKMPDAVKEERRKTAVRVERDELRKLQRELHCWTYLHVAEIDAKYRQVHPSDTDRADEIAAPLRVFAALAGDPELSAQLELALVKQRTVQHNLDDPIVVLREAVRNLIARGFTSVSPTHVVMEMMNLFDPNFGKTNTTEIPRWAQPEWVGKMMAVHDLTDPTAPDRRERLFGHQLRVKTLRPGLVEEVRRDMVAQGAAVVTDAVKPFDFCQGCASCPYRFTNCEIMNSRIAAETQKRKAH